MTQKFKSPFQSRIVTGNAKTAKDNRVNPAEEDMEQNDGTIAETDQPKSIEQRIKEAKNEDVNMLITEISGIDDQIIRSIHASALAKKFKITLKMVSDKVEATRQLNNPDPVRQMGAVFVNLIDICTSDDGGIVYLMLNDKESQIGDPFLSEESEHYAEDKILIPPAKDQIDFLLPRISEVMKWYQAKQDRTLFEDVYHYLERFSYLTLQHKIILVSSIFASYIQDHPDIFYLPILLLYAPPARGKTRTVKAVTYASYRGIFQEQIREPVIIRLTEYFNATLAFDITDIWGQAKKRDAINTLLWRYEKGMPVHRVLNPDKGPYNDLSTFSVFGPTIIATNESIRNVLDTRCIPVEMTNMPGSYQDAHPRLALELKERLTAWRAKMMNRSLPDVDQVKGVTGRLWDISKPLLQICKMEAPQTSGYIEAELQEIAKIRASTETEDKDRDILLALRDLAPDQRTEWKLYTFDVFELVNKHRPDDSPIAVTVVGHRMRDMKIDVRTIRGVSTVFMKRGVLENLLKHHNIDIHGKRSINGHDSINEIVAEILGEM